MKIGQLTKGMVFGLEGLFYSKSPFTYEVSDVAEFAVLFSVDYEFLFREVLNYENVLAGLPGAVHIRLVIHGLDIDGGLHQIHVEFAVGLQAAADVAAQLGFKLALVGALQDDLTQLEQKNFFHCDFLQIS